MINNILVRRFGADVTMDDVAAFFVDNGVDAQNLYDPGECRRMVTAYVDDPDAAVAACDRQMLLDYKVRVEQI